jgi:CubicO group peptidase (beta-lactamase class C family)
MKSLFVPGTKGYYSDINFRLPGQIIETITNTSYPDICKELIIKPPGLFKIYIYQDPDDNFIGKKNCPYPGQ